MAFSAWKGGRENPRIIAYLASIALQADLQRPHENAQVMAERRHAVGAHARVAVAGVVYLDLGSEEGRDGRAV